MRKSTFQGRKKRKLYDKAVKEEKGKMPKSSRKAVRDKSKKVLQMRAQLPLGELKKYIRTKEGNFWKRRAHFPYGDSVSKLGKSRKLS